MLSFCSYSSSCFVSDIFFHYKKLYVGTWHSSKVISFFLLVNNSCAKYTKACHKRKHQNDVCSQHDLQKNNSSETPFCVHVFLQVHWKLQLTLEDKACLETFTQVAPLHPQAFHVGKITLAPKLARNLAQSVANIARKASNLRQTIFSSSCWYVWKIWTLKKKPPAGQALCKVGNRVRILWKWLMLASKNPTSLARESGISTGSMRKYALSTLNIYRNTELLQTFGRSQIQDGFCELFPLLRTGASNGPCNTLKWHSHIFASGFWLYLRLQIGKTSNNWSQLSLFQIISKKDHFATRKSQSEVLCIEVRFLALWRSGRWRHLPFPPPTDVKRQTHVAPPWCARVRPAWRYKSMGRKHQHRPLPSSLKQYFPPSTMNLSPSKAYVSPQKMSFLNENISTCIRILPLHSKSPPLITVEHVSASIENIAARWKKAWKVAPPSRNAFTWSIALLHRQNPSTKPNAQAQRSENKHR